MHGHKARPSGSQPLENVSSWPLLPPEDLNMYRAVYTLSLRRIWFQGINPFAELRVRFAVSSSNYLFGGFWFLS